MITYKLTQNIKRKATILSHLDITFIVIIMPFLFSLFI